MHIKRGTRVQPVITVLQTIIMSHKEEDNRNACTIWKLSGAYEGGQKGWKTKNNAWEWISAWSMDSVLFQSADFCNLKKTI